LHLQELQDVFLFSCLLTPWILILSKRVLVVVGEINYVVILV
jgi:hypothetical protein